MSTINPLQAVSTMCNMIRAAVSSARLIQKIDKLCDHPDAIKVCSIATRIGLLAFNLFETILVLAGKATGTKGLTLKACELFIAIMDFPVQAIEALSDAERDQSSTIQKAVRIFERAILRPCATLLHTLAGMVKYQEQYYLELVNQDPNAERPIYNFDDEGIPQLQGYEPIDANKCRENMETCNRLEIVLTPLEIAADLGAIEGFYKILATRILFINPPGQGPGQQPQFRHQFHQRIPPPPTKNPNPPRNYTRRTTPINSSSTPSYTITTAPSIPQPPIAITDNRSKVPGENDLIIGLLNRTNLLLWEKIDESLESDPILKQYQCNILFKPIRYVVADPTSPKPLTERLYEKASILSHLATNKKKLSPLTMLPLLPSQLVDCPDIQKEIDERLEYLSKQLNQHIKKNINNKKNDINSDEINKKSTHPKKIANGPLGLINNGNSCYLNSAIQLIFNIPPLRTLIANSMSNKEIMKNFKELLKAKDVSDASKPLAALAQIAFNKNEEDMQDVEECLRFILGEMDWKPIRIQNTLGGKPRGAPDTECILRVAIEGKKSFQEALDSNFKPVNPSANTSIPQLLNEPEYVIIQLERFTSNPNNPKNTSPLSYPANGIVSISGPQGKILEYEIITYINHIENGNCKHFTTDLTYLLDPPGNRRWIHCDDDDITEEKPKNPEQDAYLIALKKL